MPRKDPAAYSSVDILAVLAMGVTLGAAAMWLAENLKPSSPLPANNSVEPGDLLQSLVKKLREKRDSLIDTIDRSK